MVSGAALKVSDGGLRVIVGAVPVPLSVMTWLPSESTIVIVEVRAPAAGGLNVTGKMQFPPLAARFVPAPQSRLLPTIAKPSGFVPAGPLGNGFSPARSADDRRARHRQALESRENRRAGARR